MGNILSYSTADGQTITLTYGVTGRRIYQWYKENIVAEHILQNPEKFGVSDEKEALETAIEALDIIDDCPLVSEIEQNAIFEAIKWRKGE